MKPPHGQRTSNALAVLYSWRSFVFLSSITTSMFMARCSLRTPGHHRRGSCEILAAGLPRLCPGAHEVWHPGACPRHEAVWFHHWRNADFDSSWALLPGRKRSALRLRVRRSSRIEVLRLWQGTAWNASPTDVGIHPPAMPPDRVPAAAGGDLPLAGPGEEPLELQGQRQPPREARRQFWRGLPSRSRFLNASSRFRRSLPDGALRRCLDRLSNRLTKIVFQALNLTPPEK